MRIITGKRARYKLIGPKDKTTRPITDMVKESLFSILGDKVKDKNVADLFCGTGSIGLECISRGAAHAIMVDMDRDALSRLRKNIEKLEFKDQTTPVRSDIFKYGIPKISKLNETTPDGLDFKCDLVFVDPPFPLSRDTAPRLIQPLTE